MSPLTMTGIFFVGLILGAIILYAGIQIGRQIERMHIITQVHRYKAEAARREEQIL